MRLGVLDIRNPRWAIELAPDLERLGYARYWLGEHHDGAEQSGSPEVLTGIIAAITSRMRVGPAGILLQYYSPFKIAQSFRLLDGLYSPRVDLGVARGLGSAPAIAGELLEGRLASVESYESKVRQLAQLLQGRLPPGHPAQDFLGLDGKPPNPEFWVLGTTRRSALLAASVGAAYAFSEYIARMTDAEADGPGIIGADRQAFQPSPALAAPRWNVAIAGAAVSRPRATFATRPMAGPAPVVGTLKQWRGRLRDVSEQYEADELIILDICESLADRRRSLTIVAEAADLVGAR
jgi:luciferase family oxidoreductase group 1